MQKFIYDNHRKEEPLLPLLGGLPAGPKNETAENRARTFSFASEMYRIGAVSEAYAIFKNWEGEQDHPALLYNLALCHIKARQHEQALNYLDRALATAKKRPLENRMSTDETYRLLTELEWDSDDYTFPMPENAPEISPRYTKDSIRRLLVDCCIELGLWDRVQILSEAIKPKRYANIEKALQKRDKEE